MTNSEVGAAIVTAVAGGGALFTYLGKWLERRKTGAEAGNQEAKTIKELLEAFRESMNDVEGLSKKLLASENEKINLMHEAAIDKALLQATINELNTKLEAQQARHTGGLRTLRQEMEHMAARQSQIFDLLSRMEAQAHGNPAQKEGHP